MLLFILKSSACLAVFIVFYKLCLEKTSAHKFKRFYLLAVILISICIPFIVFTEYVETTLINLNAFEGYGNAIAMVETPESKSFIEYIPSIVWGLYALGVILFSIRFFKNLYQIVQKIKAKLMAKKIQY